MAKKIRALYIEPKRTPRVIKVKNDYKDFQRAVKGTFECAYYFNDVCFVMNECGKINHMTPNRCVVKDGHLIDVIAGPFMIIANEEGESLSEELIEKYSEMFKQPEYFFVDKNEPRAVLMGSLIGMVDEYKLANEHSVYVRRMMPTTQFAIYQLKDNSEHIRFFNYEYLVRKGLDCYLHKDNYKVVYRGDLYANETANDIYERFNINHPYDYKTSSLSVGDVIVIKEGRKKIALFVDDIGFEELPEFFKKAGAE